MQKRLRREVGMGGSRISKDQALASAEETIVTGSTAIANAGVEIAKNFHEALKEKEEKEAKLMRLAEEQSLKNAAVTPTTVPVNPVIAHKATENLDHKLSELATINNEKRNELKQGGDQPAPPSNNSPRPSF